MTNYTITRNIGEVASLVKRQFGDEAGVQIDDFDLMNWVNEAQSVIVNKNKPLKSKLTVNTVPGTATYSYPSTANQVESVHVGGKRIRNMTFPEAEEYVFSADPEKTATGTPILWYEWGGQITFWPVPSDVQAIDFYVNLKAPHVGSNVDPLTLPDQYFSDIVSYALYKAYELDEDFQNANIKLQQFEASLNEKLNDERTAQTMTYDTITTYDW